MKENNEDTKDLDEDQDCAVTTLLAFAELFTLELFSHMIPHKHNELF